MEYTMYLYNFLPILPKGKANRNERKQDKNDVLVTACLKGVRDQLLVTLNFITDSGH